MFVKSWEDQRSFVGQRNVSRNVGPLLQYRCPVASTPVSLAVLTK